MIEVYAFRHGETDWNVLRKLQGNTDRPLNDVGLKQAQSLAPLFMGLGIEAIISSDLIRAAHTAEAVATLHGIALHFDSRLREAIYGDVEGLTRDEAIERHGALAWARWISASPEDFDFALPAGESRRQITTRIQACIDEFARRHPEIRRIALSTHGGTLKRLIGMCENAPAGDFWIANCEVHQLSFERKSGIWTYGAKLIEARI